MPATSTSIAAVAAAEFAFGIFLRRGTRSFHLFVGLALYFCFLLSEVNWLSFWGHSATTESSVALRPRFSSIWLDELLALSFVCFAVGSSSSASGGEPRVGRWPALNFDFDSQSPTRARRQLCRWRQTWQQMLYWSVLHAVALLNAICPLPTTFSPALPRAVWPGAWQRLGEPVQLQPRNLAGRELSLHLVEP